MLYSINLTSKVSYKVEVNQGSQTIQRTLEVKFTPNTYKMCFLSNYSMYRTFSLSI